MVARVKVSPSDMWVTFSRGGVIIREVHAEDGHHAVRRLLLLVAEQDALQIGDSFTVTHPGDAPVILEHDEGIAE